MNQLPFPKNGTFARFESEGDIELEREFPAARDYLVVNMICRKCNNGWMNDLEVAVRPHLEPLIRADETTITNEGRRLIASWTLKTAFVREFVHPPYIAAPQSIRTDFMDRRTVPDLGVIVAAKPMLEADNAHHSHQQLSVGTDDATEHFGMQVTFALGHVALRTVAVWMPHRTRTLDLYADEAALWPRSGNIKWPPRAIPPLADYAEFRAYHARLSTPLPNYTNVIPRSE